MNGGIILEMAETKAIGSGNEIFGRFFRIPFTMIFAARSDFINMGIHVLFCEFKSVSIKPGRTVTTLIPSGFNSIVAASSNI